MIQVQSKYLAHAERLQKEGGAANLFKLTGDVVLIERLPKQDLKTAGGIIVASSLSHVRSETEEHRSDFGVVLAVGEGYTDDDGNLVKSKFKTGEVVFYTRMGVRPLSDFPGYLIEKPGELGLIRDRDVLGYAESIEAFNEYCQRASD